MLVFQTKTSLKKIRKRISFEKLYINRYFNLLHIHILKHCGIQMYCAEYKVEAKSFGLGA